MKGTNPTKADRELWHDMAGLGCIACRKDGLENPFVSIHHIDGKTKPGAHQKVIPLCGFHHQLGGIDENGNKVEAVHVNKARFEKKYGKQLELLAEVMQLLGRT